MTCRHTSAICRLLVMLSFLGAAACTAREGPPKSAQPSARDVLTLAQEALVARSNLAADYESRGVERTVRPPVPGRPDFRRHTSGRYVASGGRNHITRLFEVIGADGSRQDDVVMHKAWDGRTQKTFYPAQKVGFIDPERAGPATADGGLLLTAAVDDSAPRPEGVEPRSVFEELLLYADPGQLRLATEKSPQGDELFRVTGPVPWGKYEAWIDPGRDYNLVRFVADMEGDGDAERPDRLRYELDAVRLRRVGDKWAPQHATLRTSGERQAGAVAWESDAELTLSNIELVTGDEAESMLALEFPEGIVVEDRIADELNDGRKGLPDANKVLADALAEAAASGRQVFVRISASWCGPCRRLDAVLHRPAVDGGLRRGLVVVKLDTGQMTGVESIGKRYGTRGAIPWCAVLSADGAVVAERLGFPADRTAIEAMVKMLADSPAGMTAEQVSTLRAAFADAAVGEPRE